MDAPQLLKGFQACRRYRQAPAWQKPWIDPRRFLRNQLMRFGVSPGQPGNLRTVAAFHLPEFTVVSGEGVSQEISSYGFFEPDLTEAFLRLIKPGQVAIDIGMHLGYYATLFALVAGEQGQVHGFEPTPSTREIAKRNTDRFPQIQVHPFAVWSSIGTLRFQDFGLQWMAFNSFGKPKLGAEPVKPNEIEVQTTTLDRFRESLDRPVALVKIDAESAEREIVAGGTSLLKTDRPIVTVEVGDSDGSGSSRALVGDLVALEYVPWEFRTGRFLRHELRAEYTYDNLIFAPGQRDLSAV
ncbi:MAG: FkbM family methyltransferase [Verrucomicrobia bacterium]|nr:FkbM family methyltransferase [Verrucomicrobiota bacterium]